MGFQDYVSEIEATAITGISGATLNRFVEAGYLQVESDTDGLRLYMKSALVNLFGAGKIGGGGGFADAPPVNFTPDNGMSGERLGATHSRTAACSTESGNCASKIEVSCTSGPGATESGSAEEETEVDDEREAGPKTVAAPAETTASEQSFERPMFRSGLSSQIERDIFSPGRPAQREPSQGSDFFSRFSDQKFEIYKMQQIMQMQEKLLDMKDREIKDLKEQRDWLRERVHKFEEKADRDQILLLSETQTIRKLMLLQESKKSVMQLALEWFGFAKPTPNTNMMIDISGQQFGQNKQFTAEQSTGAAENK